MQTYYSKNAFLKIIYLFITVFPIQVQAIDLVLEKPHTFTAGTPARASEVNMNFDVAYEHIQKLLNIVCKYHSADPLCNATPAQETYTNDFGMTFVYIPPGTFPMGSPEDEIGRQSGEDLHSVTLTQGFYIQTTEVTQWQWKAVMGSNPSNFSDCGNGCPVEMVSWDDAQEFIQKLNQHENTNKYSLPTEAQWEYASRSGSTSALANGNLVNTECNLDTNLSSIAWYCGNADNSTHPVAQKHPNAWGVYDMHGNVKEWCQDWFSGYPTNSVTDPVGPTTGNYKVHRGGSYRNHAENCRSAYRYSNTTNLRSLDIGFRVLMMP